MRAHADPISHATEFFVVPAACGKMLSFFWNMSGCTKDDAQSASSLSMLSAQHFTTANFGVLSFSAPGSQVPPGVRLPRGGSAAGDHHHATSATQ
jgi:hypothetical protein